MSRNSKVLPKDETIHFEAAMEQLEKIVKELEQGELPLEESLAAFAEGMNLSEICLAKLNQAEKTLDKILSSRDGVVKEKQLSLLEDE
ncbi:MAG: exodeoxyribonuclease VII small subunit [Sporomusaceae bacterium]|nr:exodeoxyribonuclease VII small subunit [Sporomusaceae bacterium]